MADIVVNSTSVSNDSYCRHIRCGTWWISPLVGYLIFIYGTDGTESLVYSKTTDGGSSYGAPVTIANPGSIPKFDSYPDWDVPGNSGGKIHIAYLDDTNNGIWYASIDTDDSDNIDTYEINEFGINYDSRTADWTYSCLTITKTRGGNLAAIYRIKESSTVEIGLFTSENDGATWAEETANSTMDDDDDQFMAFPGNEADPRDFYVLSKNGTGIVNRLYDDSADTWDSDSIVPIGLGYSELYFNFSGAIRLSDGNLIATYWTDVDNGGDLVCIDIAAFDSITLKTNVVDDTSEYVQCAVFIDQKTNDIYVAYLGGSTWTSSVGAKYKKSSDGGSNWGSEVDVTDDADDDHRFISVGSAKRKGGGNFAPVWWDEDNDDIFTTYDNKVLIEAKLGGLIPIKHYVLGLGTNRPW